MSSQYTRRSISFFSMRRNREYGRVGFVSLGDPGNFLSPAKPKTPQKYQKLRISELKSEISGQRLFFKIDCTGPLSPHTLKGGSRGAINHSVLPLSSAQRFDYNLKSRFKSTFFSMDGPSPLARPLKSCLSFFS